MIRILHFSDVHVQDSFGTMPMGELIGKRLLAAGNLWLKRGRLFRDAQQKLGALVRLAHAERVDLALCTGDYTAVGSEAEYAKARTAIEPLTRLPLGLCTVPGNHDLYLADTLREARFERHFGDLTRGEWPDAVADGAFPFVRLVGEGLAVVGVNSAKPNPNPFSSSGLVSASQLAALERILGDDRLRGRWVLVMTHYGILRRDGKPDSAHHGLENAAAFLRLLARPGVLLVHGHIHHRFHHRPNAEQPWLFCAGSATQRDREGLWLYELEGHHLRAIPGRWNGADYVLETGEVVELGCL